MLIFDDEKQRHVNFQFSDDDDVANLTMMNDGFKDAMSQPQSYFSILGTRLITGLDIFQSFELYTTGKILSVCS